MIPDFIPTSLKLFWLFFAFLSLLPMILAILTQFLDGKRNEKQDHESHA